MPLGSTLPAIIAFSPNPSQISFERSGSELKDVLMTLKLQFVRGRSTGNITSLQKTGVWKWSMKWTKDSYSACGRSFAVLERYEKPKIR
jgi:hypothetical protein